MKIKLNLNSEDKDSKKNETLKSLTKLVEEKRELLSKLSLGGTTKDIDKLSKQLQTTLTSPSMMEAFKSAELYKSTLNDFKKSLTSQSISSSMQKLFDTTIPSHLKKDYSLAFKATDQFKKTEEQLKSLGILKDHKKEWEQLSRITGVVSPLDYAKEISKATTGLSQLSFSERMKNISKEIDIVDSKKDTTSKFNETDNISNRINEFNNYQHKVIRIQQEKIAKREQREQKFYENSEIQIELLKSIIEYMDNQSQNLSIQNDILSEQVEKIKTQNNKAEEQINEIKKQNKLMQKQQEENRKSSNIALWVAIVVGFGSIILPYLIYKWQDTSDNKNHSELLQAIQKTGSSKDLEPLIKEQINSSTKTNKLLEKFLQKSRQNLYKPATKSIK